MKRTANFISFRHAARAPRQLRFVRMGKKGLHATGGVWGERDWFERLEPNAAEAIAGLRQRLQQYLAEGFSIDRVRIHDQKFAAVLGLPAAKKPPAIAKAKLKASKAGQTRATDILERAMPKNAGDFKRDIEAIKAIYYEPLGSDLRRRLKVRLELLYKAVVRRAKSEPAFATRARRFVPPRLLPKPAPRKRAQREWDRKHEPQWPLDGAP